MGGCAKHSLFERRLPVLRRRRAGRSTPLWQRRDSCRTGEYPHRIALPPASAPTRAAVPGRGRRATPTVVLPGSVPYRYPRAVVRNQELGGDTPHRPCPCRCLSPMNVARVGQLGECRHPSPIAFATADEVWLPSEVQWRSDRPPDDLLLFERAGPRERLFFKPAETRAAIVTCGGLCPGINNVVRSVTRELLRGYEARSVIGIRGGYRGLDPSRGRPPIELTDEVVEDIHKEGGTLLRTSRGSVDIAVAVDFLIRRNVNMLFTVGGDGTQRGGRALFEQASGQGYPLAVVGIPKTIDNDVRYVSRTFGFGTAVDEAVHVIDSRSEERRVGKECRSR